MDKKFIESVALKLFSEVSQDKSELTKEVIDNIVKDIDINSALNKIERSAAGRDYFLRSLIEDEENATSEIENRFAGVKFNRAFNHILKARWYGYSCFEIIYNEDYSVDSLIPLPHEHVKYDEKEKKWLLEAGRDKLEITHEKFLLCIHKWSPKKQMGESIFEACHSSFLDKELFRNQLRGIAKKYGDVIMVFGFDPGEDEEKVRERAENLKEMQGKTAIGIPVEGLGATDGADIKNAVQFIKLSDLEPEIYTALEAKEKEKLIQNILGSTLTMAVGDKGTQALGTIHMEAEKQVVEECCSFISDSLQNLLKADAMNFGYNHKDFYFSLEEKKDREKEAAYDMTNQQILSQKIDNIARMVEAGYPLSKEYVAEYLGIEVSQIGDVIKEFASKKKIDNLLDKNRGKKDKILKQAEEAFLKKFSKGIKEQVTAWAFKMTLNPLELNFDSLYDHAIVMELMAYINNSDDTLEFGEETNPFDMKFHEAIKFALDKKPELFENIDTFQEQVRAKAFWVKRSTEITATEKVMKELQKSLDNGGTYKEFLKDIDSVIDKVGMGNDGWYSANVYRTNMLSFYNSGVYQQQNENLENQPYWLYDGVGDNRQSDICKELDGKVYKADDPIWGKIYPPNHYACRSGVIALSDDDLESYGLKASKPTKTIKELDLGSFEGNPADSYWKNLEKNVKIKEKKLEQLTFDFDIQMFAARKTVDLKYLKDKYSFEDLAKYFGLNKIDDTHYVSPAGLIYEQPDEFYDRDRILHILKQHFNHKNKGNFLVKNRSVIKMIDDAYLYAVDNIQPYSNRGNIIYDVEISKKGNKIIVGKQEKKPLYKLRIVLQSDGKSIISAFPKK